MGPDNDVPELPPDAGAAWPRLAEEAEAADREEDGPVILTLSCPCCGRPWPRHPAA